LERNPILEGHIDINKMTKGDSKLIDQMLNELHHSIVKEDEREVQFRLEKLSRTHNKAEIARILNDQSIRNGGLTLLHWACGRKETPEGQRVLKILLKHGARADLEASQPSADKRGETPVDVAKKKTEFLRIILEHPQSPEHVRERCREFLHRSHTRRKK